MSDSKEAYREWRYVRDVTAGNSTITAEELWDAAYEMGQSAKVKAAKPVAAIKGWFHGECVIQALDPEMALPAGMALYAHAQVDEVNQQLLEALKACESTLTAIEDWGSSLTIEESLALARPAILVFEASKQTEGSVRITWAPGFAMPHNPKLSREENIPDK